MKWNSRELATQAGTMGFAWVLGRLLSSPKGEFLSRKIDDKVGGRREKFAAIFRRKTRNARRHRGLAIAGLAAVAVGTALLVGSTKK